LFNIHFPGQPGKAGYQNVPFWILLELRMMEVVHKTNKLELEDEQSSGQITTINKPTSNFLQAG